MYDLKITRKQYYLIESKIFDLCNVPLNRLDLQGIEDIDRIRISVKRKYHRSCTNYVYFKNLTTDELNFISDEMEYWHNGFERSRSDISMSNRIIRNIKDILDKQKQRNLKILEILK